MGLSRVSTSFPQKIRCGRPGQAWLAPATLALAPFKDVVGGVNTPANHDAVSGVRINKIHGVRRRTSATLRSAAHAHGISWRGINRLNDRSRTSTKPYGCARTSPWQLMSVSRKLSLIHEYINHKCFTNRWGFVLSMAPWLCPKPFRRMMLLSYWGLMSVTSRGSRRRTFCVARIGYDPVDIVKSYLARRESGGVH